MKKYSKKFNRDYDFYLQNLDTFSFGGVNVGDDMVFHDPTNGVPAKQSFWNYDTQGKLLPTNEPELLKRVIICKKSINLHIKMWVGGYEEMMEGIDYYMNLFHGQPPRWVEDSFRKQLQKKIRILLRDRKKTLIRDNQDT